jgi:putative redox protein
MSAETSSAASVGETIVVEETDQRPFQVKVTAGPTAFLVDEPVAAGGHAGGPNPYDLLSAAIGSCSVMTIRLYAERRKWPLEKVRVNVTHFREALRARDRFVREVRLFGALDDAQRAKLLEISTRCPVHLTIERGSDVQTVLVEREAGEAKTAGRCDHARDVKEACE